LTAAERGVLLLCCALGDPDARPLSMAQFRELSRRAGASGAGDGDTAADVRPEHLRRLSYDETESARIAALLCREALLDKYLRAAERLGIVPVTRVSLAYPAPVVKKRGMSCPPALFCAGNRALLASPCVGLAGSRKLHGENERFARRVGELAAREALTLVTGGAEGADSASLHACLDAGGSAVLFIPDELARRAESASERCLVVSEGGYDLPFSPARALSRNALIHMMGDKTLIAQTRFGAGGTWAGAAENLRHGWSELYVFADGSEGARALCGRGAEEVAELVSLRALRPAQSSFPTE